MHRSALTLALVLLLAGAASAWSPPDGKLTWIGGGGYGVMFDYHQAGAADEQYEGFAIFAGRAVNRNVALRTHIYFTEHEDVSDIKLRGFDLQGLFGANLDRVGFKYYGIAGFWSEEQSADVGLVDFSKRFSGLLIGFGIGYNWNGATLDWWGAGRTPGDYEDWLEDVYETPIDVTNVVGGLTLGFRF